MVARATDSFAERFSLGESVLPALAEEFGGDVGGHAGVDELQQTSIDDVGAVFIAYLEGALRATFTTVS
ncbi:hypothetical protein B9H04_06835 [Halorubrum ezzemoulense DSM 17463]|uniref:Uncharacterized protein n=1 Tax=Halorubrum ezzemoulense DSM 17463 TaxID=1121945 RepID=A0A1X4H8M2_HALEZ|nr:hypothetical protein [Halorubrum ezzemoulense]OSP08273.1 hypothetical protein B9H04_06835 [Halorubrum ezzemoulense DSM 17463]